MSEELIAAAHRDHNAAVLHVRVEILLDFLQPAADDHLLPVAPTTQQDDIDLRKVDGIAQIVLSDLSLISPPQKAHLHALDIPAVSIQIQEVRIQMSDRNLHVFFSIAFRILCVE